MSKVLVSSMKNEGPFILEWIAYHKVLGFNGFVIGANDCEDRSDELLKALAWEGLISFRENTPPPGSDPQHMFLKDVSDNYLVRHAEWLMVLDSDEFLAVTTGAFLLNDLISKFPDVDALPILWKNFGDSGHTAWDGSLVVQSFTRCEDNIDPGNRYHKTLFRNSDAIGRFDAHYPTVRKPYEAEKLVVKNTQGMSYPGESVAKCYPSLKGVQPLESFWTWDNAYVCHFPYKTRDLYLMKRYRGDNVATISNTKYADGSWYEKQRNRNSAYDDHLLGFVPKVIEEMESMRTSRIIRVAEENMLVAFQGLRDKILNS